MEINHPFFEYAAEDGEIRRGRDIPEFRLHSFKGKDKGRWSISLRRCRIPAFGERDIYEVKLGDEFLMSSMFYAAE